MIRTCQAPLALALLFSVAGTCPAQDKVTLAKGDRIVFLGDSITAGGVGPRGYVTFVKKALGDGVEIVGAGISGNKVPDLQRRLGAHVLDRKPNVVVVYIGINDVWHGEKDPKRGTPKDKFEAGLKDVLGRIKEAGAKPILCTPSVIGEKSDGKNTNDPKLDEYAAVSRAVAKELGIPLVDLRAAFVAHLKANNKDNAAKGILTNDGVHLNEAGNKLVAEKILEVLTR